MAISFVMAFAFVVRLGLGMTLRVIVSVPFLVGVGGFIRLTAGRQGKPERQ